VVSSADDLFRWTRALDRRSVLDAPHAAALVEPRVQIIPGEWYARGWFVRDTFATRMIEHGGDYIHGSNAAIHRFPDRGLTVVITSNARAKNALWLRWAVQDRVEQILFGEPVELPPTTVESGAGLAVPAGRFVFDDGSGVEITSRPGALALSPVGQMAVELLLGPNPNDTLERRMPSDSLNARVRAFGQALARGDVEPLLAFLRPEVPRATARPRVQQYLRDAIAAHGPLLELLPVGSVPNSSGPRFRHTLVRVRFERAEEYVRFLWQGDLLYFAVPSASDPIVVKALPAPGGGFASFDLFSGHSAQIAFRESGGAASVRVTPIRGMAREGRRVGAGPGNSP
jgi:hypothetical protein